MKVWVRREEIEKVVHSLPFLAWVRSFNEWVPGRMQYRKWTGEDTVKVYFYPFEGYGKTEAIVPIGSTNVDAALCKGLIRGGMPVEKYLKVKEIVRK